MGVAAPPRQHDTAGNALLEYEMGSVNNWTQTIRMFGEPLALRRSGVISYIHTDHLGRPEVMTNASKTVVWRANNFAFDRSVALDTIGGLKKGYPGQSYDAETGLWHNYMRDYDGLTGRYVESDPIGLHGGLNTYAYVGANPVHDFDPIGLASPLAVVIGVARCGFGAFGGNLAVDALKAAKQDFDELQAERKESQKGGGCDSSDDEELGQDSRSDDGAGVVIDAANAFASQGAGFYRALGVAALTGGVGLGGCTLGGAIAGAIWGNGDLSRTVDGYVLDAAHALGGD